MHAHAEAHAHTHTCTCAYMCTHALAHTHKHTRTHTQTHTHTDIRIQGLFLGKVWVFVQHTYKCFLSVLQEGLPSGAVVRSICQASWPLPTSTLDRKRTSKQVMFGELKVCSFFFRDMHGWMEMDVWVNVFAMPFLCAESGPWRKMSRAWPVVSVITTSSVTTCPSHQESA